MSGYRTPADLPGLFRALAGRVSALERRGAAGRLLVVGTDVPFQNGWTNLGLGTLGAGFWKDASGTVHLQGVVTGGTVSSGATGAAFTLPAGYRPVAQAVVPALVYNNVLGRVDVSAGGLVLCTIGNNGFFCLDGISFKAA